MGDISRPGVQRSRPSPHPQPLGWASLRALARRLEPRDLVLAHLLEEHRTLTTDQITRVLFTAVRTCRNRLNVLRRLGFIAWFIPVRHRRRLGTHWLPGLLSARYVALASGQRPPTPRAVRELQDRVVASPQLSHTVGTNGVFVALLAQSRALPGTRLARWWSGPAMAAAVNRRVQPDGHGVWREDGHTVAFYLEYDTGTETLATVVGKLPAYRRLQDAGGPRWPVLFVLPSRARERNLLQRFAAAGTCGVVVATSTQDRAGTDPAGPIWTLPGDTGPRLRLIEVPSELGWRGPLHPGPPSPDQDPLRLLLDPP
ncbi:replication-relaxation family protein [Dactylosporangium aurantiacum]|uniref:Replication-relaxation family protein n=1 Tax=Dactylosporangium aurantiacum TaxID=35754 RepID=A0A9Q9MJA6_9ACTN|nr:replication-relaxation family protein [Dactylosporangium aurantiacum]MDG6104016.1 replication-relaxation family protein [Dactylosporangium aurantiacum]UWZ58809.1 replication-relaxation family protein [Dactylosporangium aurantiacum]